jgi:CRISPR-associated protein Csd2
MSVHIDPAKRHDFVLLFDVTDGNPNGDPDAGNLPRVDPETMQGLVTDVCLKRKLRDYVTLARSGAERYNVYVEHKGAALNTQHGRAYTAYEKDTSKKVKDKAKPSREEQDWTRQWMCGNFFDIRLFGAVMTTKVNCGQVRGPLQLTFARSIDPVVPLDVSITRVAVTREEDAVKATAGDDGSGGEGKQTEMGRKALLPYGLYLGHGFFNPHFAAQTGADGDDLALVWEALVNMFEQDRSAARGMMACRGLYVFTHDKPLGNAPAHKLFERVSARLNEGVEAPRKFSDYTVTVDSSMPDGVTLTKVLD